MRFEFALTSKIAWTFIVLEAGIIACMRSNDNGE